MAEQLSIDSFLSKRQKLDSESSDGDSEVSHGELNPVGSHNTTSKADTSTECSGSSSVPHTAESAACSSACCSGDKVNCPAITYKSQKGRYGRSICGVWFHEYSLLTYCESQAKVYCFYCRSARLKHLITFSTKADRAFTVQGFSNWKAKSRFAVMRKAIHIVKPV